MKRVFGQVAALLLGAVAAGGAQAAGVLRVDNVSGQASVDRLGTRVLLKAGDTLSERDVVHVADGGSLALDFSGHGFVELGSGAELGVEKLPFASYADDLKTIFSLTRGYLRVVWKLPPMSGSDWPLYVYFGSQHATLIPGEYFFDSRPGAARACVVAGRLSVLPNAGTQLQKLQPSACYRFTSPGLPPERVAHDPAAWIAVRHSFNIDAPTSPEAMLAANDSSDAADAGPDSGVTTTGEPIPPPRPAPARPSPMLKPMPPSVAPVPKPAPPSAPAPMPAPPAAATPGQPPAEASAAPGPASAAGGDWGVNVASYPAADAAQKQAQQLRAAGFSAAVQQAQVKGQTWYRVQLKGYATPDEARAAAAQLQARFNYQGLWVTRTGSGGGTTP